LGAAVLHGDLEARGLAAPGADLAEIPNDIVVGEPFAGVLALTDVGRMRAVEQHEPDGRGRTVMATRRQRYLHDVVALAIDDSHRHLAVRAARLVDGARDRGAVRADRL